MHRLGSWQGKHNTNSQRPKHFGVLAVSSFQRAASRSVAIRAKILPSYGGKNGGPRATSNKGSRPIQISRLKGGSCEKQLIPTGPKESDKAFGCSNYAASRTKTSAIAANISSSFDLVFAPRHQLALDFETYSQDNPAGEYLWTETRTCIRGACGSNRLRGVASLEWRWGCLASTLRELSWVRR